MFSHFQIALSYFAEEQTKNMVSVLGPQNLDFGENLEESDMRPWWETLRSRFSVLTVISSLLVMYISILSSTTRCLPEKSPHDGQMQNYTVVIGGFVDSYCANQLHAEIAFAGVFSVFLVILHLFAAASWLYLPKVINSLRNLKIARELLSDLHFTIQQTREMFWSSDIQANQNDFKKSADVGTHLLEGLQAGGPSTCAGVSFNGGGPEETKGDCFDSELLEGRKPPKNKQETVKFRKACKLICDWDTSVNLKSVYFTRTFILLLYTGCLLGAAVYYSWYLITKAGQHFECALNGSDFQVLEDAVGHLHTFFCTYTLPRMFSPIFVFLAMTFAFQAIFCVIGLWQVDTKIGYPSKPAQYPRIEEFMNKLFIKRIALFARIPWRFLVEFGILLYKTLYLLVCVGLIGLSSSSSKSTYEKQKRKDLEEQILLSNLTFLKLFWESSRPAGAGCFGMLLSLTILKQAVGVDATTAITLIEQHLKFYGNDAKDDVIEVMILICVKQAVVFKEVLENLKQKSYGENESILSFIVEDLVLEADKRKDCQDDGKYAYILFQAMCHGAGHIIRKEGKYEEIGQTKDNPTLIKEYLT